MDKIRLWVLCKFFGYFKLSRDQLLRMSCSPVAKEQRMRFFFYENDVYVKMLDAGERGVVN